jgi:hypothetical protein
MFGNCDRKQKNTKLICRVHPAQRGCLQVGSTPSVRGPCGTAGGGDMRNKKSGTWGATYAHPSLVILPARSLRDFLKIGDTISGY